MHRKTRRFRPFLERLETRDLLATYIVNNQHAGASDGNNGLTEATPWLTLQHAADQVEPGDTVLVRAGTYVGFQIETSGSPGNWITFQADDGVLINAAGNGRDGINIELASWIIIDGFHIEGNNGTAINRAGIRSVENDHIIIRNNIANECFKWGILTGFTDDLLIENNVTSNSLDEHGIYVSNSCFNITIRGNTIHGNENNGIHMNGDIFSEPFSDKPLTGLITNALVENNVIFNNGFNGGSGGGSGINCDGVQNSVFRNNLIYNSHASGISLYRIDGADGAKNNLVVNNTILTSGSTGRWAVNIQNGSTGNSVFNNILWSHHSNRGAIDIDPASLPGFQSDFNLVENRFTTDGGDSTPTLAEWRTATGQDQNSAAIANLADLFVNLAGDDYHLAATSLARDFGVALFNGKAAPGSDNDGLPRPSGAGFDAGAFEFQEPVTGAGSLSFELADYEVDETAGTITVTVNRTGGTLGAVSVRYATSNGTAQAGSDYTAASGTLNFADGDASESFTITILNDGTPEPDETILLSLSLPGGGAVLGSPAIATVTIHSDDVLPPFQQGSGKNGLVVIEAEHFHANVSQGGASWQPYTVGNFSGTGAMQALPDSGLVVNTGFVSNSPRLDYQVNFVKTGVHYVWIRGRGINKGADSLHVGLDGVALKSADRIGNFAAGKYRWKKGTLDGVRARIKVTTPGLHTINVWMREDGVVIDKLLLAKKAAYKPKKKGPAESPPMAALLASMLAGEAEAPHPLAVPVRGSKPQAVVAPTLTFDKPRDFAARDRFFSAAKEKHSSSWNDWDVFE